MSPMVPRTMDPLKTRMSTGSETSGEKLSLAQSFQNASLRRGSRPAVENDSMCAMASTPPLLAGIYFFFENRVSCALEPALVAEIVIRDNQFSKPILLAYTSYMRIVGEPLLLIGNRYFSAVCGLKLSLRRVFLAAPPLYLARDRETGEARGSSEINATQWIRGLCPAPGAERHIRRFQPYPARAQSASRPIRRAGADRPKSRSESVGCVRRARHSKGEFRGDDRRSRGARA